MSNRKNIKLVVLDMAGTTVNEHNVVYKTLHKSIVEAGCPCSLSDVLEHGAGKEKHQAIKDILGSLKLVADDLSIFENFKVALKEAYASLEVSTFEKMDKLFTNLRENNVKIVLNTGYNSQVARNLIEKLRWQQGRDFDFLITADDVSKGRPHPDMIKLAMKKTRITNANQVLKAGDSAIDIEEGKNAGCGLSIGVTTGAQTAEQLNSAHPDYIVDQLHDILAYIEV